MKKNVLFGLLTLMFLGAACTQSGVDPDPPRELPSFGAKLVLYYPSYGQYGEKFTAKDVLDQVTGDYAHDIFIPSFMTIGDGKTANGSETKAWIKNRVGFDDVWAWGGLIWKDNGVLDYANNVGIGSNSIMAGLAAHPEVPYGVAIGGWPKGDNRSDPLRTGGFNRIGSSPSDLSEFSDSVLQISSLAGKIRKPEYVHIDFEFPESIEEGQKLLNIVKSIHEKAIAKGEKIEIAINIGPNIDKHLEFLNFTELDKYVDDFSIMTYDFAGAWANVTGHHTPLYSGDATALAAYPNELSSKFSCDAEVKYVLSKGIKASKIKIGVALYGRWWGDVTLPTTVDPNKPYYTTGKQLAESPLTGFDEFHTIKYYNILSEVTTAKGWEIYRDPISKAPFAINRGKKMFVTYDDETSVLEKAAYVKEKRLGGIIVWDALGMKGTNIMKKLHDALK